MVGYPRPQIAFCHDLYPLYFKIQQSSLVMASKLSAVLKKTDPTERLEKCGSRLGHTK